MFPAHPMSTMGGFPFGGQEEIVAALGMRMGDHVDQCMESRFHNGDLVTNPKCHEAVEMFFQAVNDRSLIPPAPPVVARDVTQDKPRSHVYVVNGTPVEPMEGMNWLCGVLTYAGIFLILVFVAEKLCCCFNSSDEDEDDYVMLSEDNAEDNVRVHFSEPCQGYALVDEIVRDSPPCKGYSTAADSTSNQVFVGVPVQVV